MLHLYEYSFNEILNSYTFITVNGVEYFVYFTDGSNYFEKYKQFASSVYMFGFYSKPIKKLSSDILVRDTIVSILKDYFENNKEHILLYVCEQTDGLQYHRKRKFNGWFHLANESNIVKEDLDIIFENNITCLSVLYHNSNVHAEEIALALSNFESEFLK